MLLLHWYLDLHLPPILISASFTMADVDMPDAGPSAPAKASTATKAAQSGTVDTGANGKKRFEVKKV